MGNHHTSSSSDADHPPTAFARDPSTRYGEMPAEELKLWLDRAKGHLDAEALLFLSQRFQQGVGRTSPDVAASRAVGMSREAFERYMQSTGAFKGRPVPSVAAAPPLPVNAGSTAGRPPRSRVKEGGRHSSRTRPDDGHASLRRASSRRSSSCGAASRREFLLNGSRTSSAAGAARGGGDEAAPAERHPAASPPVVCVSSALDALFRAFDVDRDGVISFSDFLTFHLAMGYHTEEGLSMLLFHAFDADQDGWLSVEDLVQVITAGTYAVGDLAVENPLVRNVIYQEAERILGFLDVYQSGFVSEETFHLVGQRHPEVLEKLKYLL